MISLNNQVVKKKIRKLAEPANCGMIRVIGLVATFNPDDFLWGDHYVNFGIVV
jgi:hypothetical protein